MNDMRIVVVVLVMMVTMASTYPTYVPVARYPNVCNTMTPLHNGISPQTTPAPYSIDFSQVCYTPGFPLRVSISGNTVNNRFHGFFVQARKQNQSTFSYGTFSNNGDLETQAVDCFNTTASAICHNNTNGIHWPNKTIAWNAPEGFDSDLEFVLTIVAEFETFWVGIKKSIKSCSTTTPSSSTTTATTNQTSPDLPSVKYSTTPSRTTNQTSNYSATTSTTPATTTNQTTPVLLSSNYSSTPSTTTATTTNQTAPVLLSFNYSATPSSTTNQASPVLPSFKYSAAAIVITTAIFIISFK